MHFYRKSLISTVLSVVVFSVGIVGPSMAATSDITQAKSVMCTLKRLGDCKTDGACIWKDATARQASRQLKVDFEAKKAEFVEPTKSRPAGTVVKDEVKDGVRHFSLARRPTDPADKHMTATLDKAGALRLTRRSRSAEAPLMVADAICVKG